MKRNMLMVLVVLLGLTLALPCVSEAGRGGGGRGGGHAGGRVGGFHGGGYRYYGGYRSYGFYRPGVVIGPAVVAPLYYPGYYPVPPPVYGEPPPGYVGPYVDPAYGDPDPAYAYPDPAVTGGYGQGDPANNAGEWVTVPGQYVNGRWVGEHKAWVPASP